MKSTVVRPGGVDQQRKNERKKSWSENWSENWSWPWFNSDSEEFSRVVPVASQLDLDPKLTPELKQKKPRSSLHTKPEEGDGAIAGDPQFEGKLRWNSKLSLGVFLHSEREIRNSIERLIRAGAHLDPKPKSAGSVEITSHPEPERNSKSRANEHPQSTGDEKQTKFGSDSDTQCTKKSHHYLAIFISWYLGTAFVFLWNAILNAGDYFYSVFPEYHPSRVFPLLYIPVAFLIACGYLVSSESQRNIRPRVLIGYTIFFAAAVSVILVGGSNGTEVGSPWAFTAICTIVVLCSVAEGICGGALFGEFSFMDPTYLQAFNAGLSASGIATTALRMTTKRIFSDTLKGLRHGALAFFAISALVLFVGIGLYAFVFHKLEGVQKYRQRAIDEEAEMAGNVAGAADSGDESDRSDEISVWVDDSRDDFELSEVLSSEVGKLPETGEFQWRKKDLLFESWDYILDVIILYAVTFSIIPGFLYENTTSSNLGTWYPLLLLALFNGADFLSRIVRIERLIMRSRRALAVCSCGLVLLYIPAFYLATRYSGIWLVMLLCTLLGATNGYFTICIFDTAPLGFKSPEQSTIGTLMYLAMLMGFFIGLGADWFWEIH